MNPGRERGPGLGSRTSQDQQAITQAESPDNRTAWQPSLLNYAPDRGTTRQADPETSIEAAQSLDPETLKGLQAQVYDTLVTLGGTGTMDDVALATGRQRGSTSRRLTDLEAGGFIRRTGRTRAGQATGRRQIVWAVVDDAS